MTHLNKTLFHFLSLTIAVFLCITSCKKAAKGVSEKAIREASEDMVEKSSERGLKSLSRSALRKLDWDGIFKLIEKEDINIAKSLSKLDNGTQRAIGKAIQDDPEFLRALMSSRTLLDEFNLYTKSAPKLAKNIDFIRFFAGNDYISRTLGRRNLLEDIVLKEEGGTVLFLDKNSSELIAKYRDGVLTLDNPFIKGMNKFPEQSLLRQRLIPNSVYKISDGLGKECLYNVDNLGRLYSVKAKGISVDEMLANIINKDKNVEFGSQWNKELNKIRKTSKGGDIALEYKLNYVGEDAVPSYCHIDVSSKGKKITSKTFENKKYKSERMIGNYANRKFLKSISEEEAFQFLKKNNPDIAKVIERIEKDGKGSNLGREMYKVSVLKDGSVEVSALSKSNTYCSIIVKEDKVIASSGGFVNTKDGGMNEFLNYLMPNKTYVVNGCAEYRTDELGRVVSAYADRTKMYANPNKVNSGRYGAVQKQVVRDLDGKPTDEGGHLFSNNVNGSNSLINEVPMNREINEHGAWREFEMEEEKYIKDGKDVKSYRQIVYKGSSKRPDAIHVKLVVDGKTITEKTIKV